MNKASFLRCAKGVVLRDVYLHTGLCFGNPANPVRMICGILWPSGEHFAATLFAISGHPGGDGKGIKQVVYTDRGAYLTDLGIYGETLWYDRALPASFNGRTPGSEPGDRGSSP